MHICNNSNVEEIVFSYLIDADAFVTENTEAWQAKFEKNGISCPIKKPGEVKGDIRIIVDGASLGADYEKWEKKWEKKNHVVCIYNIDVLNQPILKRLVDIHDKMLLSLNKINLFTDKALEKEIDSLSPEIVENLVKRELKNVIMSILLSQPMCGTDLVKELYKKFRVLISPGMLYPALKELESKGLLKYECKLKNKIYTVQKREEAKSLLQKHVQASSLLSQLFEVC